MMSSTLRHATPLVTILVGLLPVLTLSVGGGSGLFYLLSLVCLLIVAAAPASRRSALLQPYRGLIACFCLPLAAALLSQAVNAEWGGAEIERGLRIALGFPCLTAGFLLVDRHRLRQFAWGPMAAGVLATAVVVVLTGPTLERPLTPQFNAVGYGNLMLLMAVLAAFSVLWPLTRHHRLESAIKITVAALTFAGFVLTQTRTGWMAIPVFALIGVGLAGWLHRPFRALAGLVGIGLLALAIGAASPALRDRVHEGAQEIRQCLTVNPVADTSMCIRLQLWNASWTLIKADPWSGIGGGSSFNEALQQRAAAGAVSPFVARNFGEPHNDVLMALVTHGLPGGFALLVMYIAPAWMFARRMRQGVPRAERAAAAMGLAVCLGFAVFGITELMFRGMRSLSLYVTLIAVFTALSSPGAGQTRQ